MRPLELTPRGIFGTVAVLVVAAGCIRLGFWQLDRRAERQARNAVIAERLDRPAIDLGRAPLDTAGLAYRRARLEGDVDDGRALILAGRSRAGAPGVQILSPVRLGDGAVLVNRGWLPSPDAATVDLDAVRLEGTIRAEGVLLPFPDVDLEHRPGGFQVTWFRFDGEAIRAQFPYRVAHLYLAATSIPETGGAGADPTAAGPEPAVGGQRTADTTADGADAGGPVIPVPLDPPSLDPGPHLSYAIQWFSFATIFLVGWAVLLVRRPGDRKERAAESD